MSKPVAAIEPATAMRLPIGPPADGRPRRGTARPIVRIHLLGAMRATTYLGDDVLPRGRKARAILGYLCLAAGERVPRAHLATMLWGRLPRTGDRDRAKLNQALSRISTAFGPLADELIIADRETVALDAGLCWIDAVAVSSADPPAPGSPRSDLAALCQGELLEGLDGVSASFDRWLVGERTRFAERLRGLLDGERRRGGRSRADTRQLPAKLRSGGAATSSLRSGRSRLRLGVLPFLGTRCSNEADLAFSLSQEVAGALARFRWFDVIAPVSLMRRPWSPAGDEQLRRGDLDYVVDGALTGNGSHFQISVRLLDLAQYARPVWSDRLELPVGQLHRFDEMVTARIVGQIDPIILFIEGQQKRRERYGATGLLLLAMPLIYSMERARFEEAGHLINRALRIDPADGMALAWAAYWQLWHVGQGWSQDVDRALAAAQDLCLKAIRIDPENAEAWGIHAHVCAWNRDFDTALDHFDRSLRLNPNLAYIWVLSALAYCYVGEPAAALKRLDRYRELAPSDPHAGFFETARTIAYTFMGDYERAVLVGRRAVRETPDFVNGYKPLIASLGHLGRRDEARPYVGTLLSLEPSFTVERFGQVYPFKKAADRERYMTGLRRAGVPEA